jgi:hypothetical protein
VVDGDLTKPTPYDDKKYGASIGITIGRELQKDRYRWVFTIDKKASDATINIPMLVIRDTLNGVGYLVGLSERTSPSLPWTEGWTIVEDEHLKASFIFTWRAGPVAIDPGVN